MNKIYFDIKQLIILKQDYELFLFVWVQVYMEWVKMEYRMLFLLMYSQFVHKTDIVYLLAIHSNLQVVYVQLAIKINTTVHNLSKDVKQIMYKTLTSMRGCCILFIS